MVHTIKNKIKRKSLFRKLIIWVLLCLILPFFCVTVVLFASIYYEGENNYTSSTDLIVQQANQIQNEHIQSMYTISARVTSDKYLAGFLLVAYSNENLQYYTTQIANTLSLDIADSDNYTPTIYYANKTIPRGFDSFFHLSDIDIQPVNDFIASENSDIWVTPQEGEQYRAIFTPFKGHYTYMKKVFINGDLLYLLTISVPQRIMNSFLDASDEFLAGKTQIVQTKDYLIVSYLENAQINENKDIQTQLSDLKEKGFVIKQTDLVGLPQQTVFLFPKNPQGIPLILIGILIIIFVVALGIIVIWFIKGIVKSVYSSIQEFEYAVHSGFKTKIKITGEDELAQIRTVFNSQIDKIQDLIKITTQQEALVTESKLKALQQQINPHFLYNTMEVFSYKLEYYGYYQEADAMVSFSNMLRYNIASEEKFASLKQEASQVANYMAIQRLKFENICFDVGIPAGLDNLQVPRFLLQPLIENCFTHGYYGEALHIILNVVEEKDHILFEIYDNGKGIDEKTLERINLALQKKENQNALGIGLHNINTRLCMFYNDMCRLCIASKEGRWTIVTWKIPKKNIKTDTKKYLLDLPNKEIDG